MRIVNKRKFIRSSLVLIGLILLFISLLTNNIFSKGEVKRKELFISYGDTLWGIARVELEENEYYQNKTIRDVIEDIKKINHLNNNSCIYEGQKLEIPYI